MNILAILGFVCSLFSITLQQQCTSSTYERCLCISSTPYCTCSALTSTNTLNFASSYNSHLVALASQGCRPCPSNCLRCSSLTVCTLCLSSFELVSGQCQACPVNCQTCSNGVCATCITGYYLDYQTNCQTCPIIGTAVCTISSLQSCLSNYWLDNNAANCISCDANCYQCSSTTKCSVCNQGFYLISNYTCSQCQTQCLTCSDANSCILCTNQSYYYNSTLGICLAGIANNCLISASNSKCSQCLPGFYLNSSSLCAQVGSSQLISGCQVYASNNGTVSCKNCSIGYFNTTSGCYYACSSLCTSCYGPHYGLCYGCIANAYLLNSHCIPIYNLMQGASYQLFYTASNNPTFFSGTLKASGGCLLESMSTSANQLSINLNSLQSYQIIIKWKIYVYSLTNNPQDSSYDVTFNNSMWSQTYSFTADNCINNCNGSSSVCINKGSLEISNIILNANQLTFIVSNASIGISQVLIIASRCGGIQGGACLECSSTSTCTKCVNTNYYISGYTCVISCPANYYVRTATKTCLSQCVSGTYPDNVQLLCVECQSPCLTCTNNTSCLTCIQNTYLFQQNCQSTCPDGYFANNMRRTCDICIRPCLTCLSNLQCLSCIYGFYDSTTHSCVLKCGQKYYGSLQTIKCQQCILPCLTCNSNIGNKCRSCVNGTYLYSSECLSHCPSGYYEYNSTCNLCDITCNTCSYSPSNCTSCPIGSYLSNYTCIFNCPLHYFADSTINLCVSCPDNCSTCINSQYCQSCLSNYVFYASYYSCLSNCPLRYYSNAGICYSCQTPCFQCSSANQCLSCQGQFLFNSTCLSICPSGSFGDTIKMECTACNLSLCKECFESANYCTSCFEPLILFSSQCLENCPQGYYLEQTNYICLSCKENCMRCISLTACLNCQSNYILQNENCIKVCDAGYYSTLINGSASCITCPSSCISCRMSNNILECLSCAVGYYNQNMTCLSTCMTAEFGYNGQCFKCITPCLECLSQSSCISCLPGLGYLFNNSCLNSCPLGYYQSSAYSCNKCSHECLNCINTPTFCISCIKGMYLQGSSCISACLSGYFLTYSSNICRKCNNICLTCTNSPTNCTSCMYNLMLINGNCLKSCSLGSYRMNGTCIKCPTSCSICLNSTYCTQCAINYYLTTSFTCVNNCSSGFFASNGLCKPCNYPCATCSSYQSCQSCLTGYLSSNICVSSCSSPTYLNNQTQTCELCPQNCSTCLNPSQCLECLQGVLVNGSCLSQCPEGYYDYYSICAPCMYGCLSCSDSSTCTECYIGYLYNGVCLQFCPIGWVSPVNSSQLVCTQCVPGCIKCTVQANQCTLCENGLFLYIYTCLADCPLGTYNNYKSSECVTCQSPCETCHNGYSCDTCIYGYLLYSEQSGNQCIQGPSCPNSFYLNAANNTCVQSCPLNSYIDPYRYTCSRPCADTFVLLKSNYTCLEYCPQGMWINSHLICEDGPPPFTLPQFSCSGLVMHNILVIDCSFNVPIENLMALTIKDFQITYTTPIEIVFINSQDVRIVTNTPVGVFRQKYFTVSLSNRYKLYSMISAANSTSLSDTQRRLDQLYPLPVQNINATFLMDTYFSYTNQQRQTGMQLMQIAQSICIGAFIFWVFSFLKNLKATSLTFVCILQWIYSLSLVDTTFAPNLGLFLEGFKISNFLFGLTPSQQSSIWLIQSSYRATLWGIINLFDFWTVFFPSIIISCFFGIIYIITLILHNKFGKNPLLSKQQSNNGLKNPIQSRISSIKSRKMVQVQGQNLNNKFKKEDDQYQKEEVSIFSNQISEKSKDHENNKLPRNVLDANDSANFVIEKSSRSRKSRFGSMKNSQKNNSKISIQNIQDKKQKLEVQKPELSSEQNWQMQRYKFGLKCKIIHDRFYYNYWLHCTLLTASPLSIAVCCQLIAANALSLSASIIFSLLTFVLIWIFIKKDFSQQKLFVTTKYWFILYIQTIIQNGMAILSTTQIYIGIMMLMLTINIYVWNRIFSSKRSNQLKHFYQINDVLRIILLLQALIGYTNAKKWDSDTYYYYSWVFIVTLIVLIVFGAVQNTKQFFDREEGAKQETEKMKQTDDGHRSQSESSIMKSRALTKHQNEEDNQENQQISDQIEFFSQHQGQDTDSDNDIIDFDQVGSGVQRKAPKELIRYEKNDYQ